MYFLYNYDQNLAESLALNDFYLTLFLKDLHLNSPNWTLTEYMSCVVRIDHLL